MLGACFICYSALIVKIDQKIGGGDKFALIVVLQGLIRKLGGVRRLSCLICYRG